MRMGVLSLRCEPSTRLHSAGHSPFTQERVTGSLQALQALPMVLSSVEGQGVVTQRTPVSRVAQTGS